MSDDQRTFTSEKLDWMDALSGDPRLDARAFEVGFCIVQAINARTGLAFISDDTISDKTGIPKRWVLRARQSLRAAGWLDWRRTKSANSYWILGGPINAVMDHQILLKEKRIEKRIKANKSRQETPPVAHLKHREAPRVGHLESRSMAKQETPQVANIHLGNNTLSLTPSKVAQPSMVVVERGNRSPRHRHEQNAAVQPERSLLEREQRLSRKGVQVKVTVPSTIHVNNVAAPAKNETQRTTDAYVDYPELPTFLDRRMRVTTELTSGRGMLAKEA